MSDFQIRHVPKRFNVLSHIMMDGPRKGDDAPVFSRSRVMVKLAITAVLWLASLIIQTVWVVCSRQVAVGETWYWGLLDVSVYDWTEDGLKGVLSILANICGYCSIVGIVFLFIGLFAAPWVFQVGMMLLLAGLAQWNGTGLGRTILVMQGETEALNGWVTVELTDWGTLAGHMPLLATGVILALLCLGLALSPLNGERSPVARIPLPASLASSLGLIGILLVEMWGEDFSRMLLVPVGLLVGLKCLPAEVRTVSDCEERRISRRWEWHSALLIWMETLMVAYTVVCLVL